MNTKLVVLFFVGLCVALSTQEKLKLTLYYESLCPYCSRFLVNQLMPTVKALGNDALLLDFVPYGHASHQMIDNKWQFSCQHGEWECYGNKVQACALNQNWGPVVELEYVHCVMAKSDPSSIESQSSCAKSMGLSWDDLYNCSINGVGDDLLVKYGERTHAFQPIGAKKPKVVPTVVFNDKYSENLQNNGISNLLQTVCSMLTIKPQGCQ